MITGFFETNIPKKDKGVPYGYSKNFWKQNPTQLEKHGRLEASSSKPKYVPPEVDGIMWMALAIERAEVRERSSGGTKVARQSPRSSPQY